MSEWILHTRPGTQPP